MNKELQPLETLNELRFEGLTEEYRNKCCDIIETALKEHKNLKEENTFLRENFENLNETYFDTWYACQRLKESSYYALMFVDNVYCLVDTTDNKFDVIETYNVNDKGIIDNATQKKLKALEIIREKGVNLHKLKICDNVEEYNKLCNSALPLTQKEYNLLKKVLL